MEERLRLVKSAIEGYLSDVENPIFKRFQADFSFGKMLRSKLILAIAAPNPASITLCAIVELIHFASLLHDDVIDDSNLRRGKQSINAKYGSKNAIMLGDILYSKAFYEVSLLDSAIASAIADCVLRLSLGELEDVALSERFNTDEARYIAMIAHKTAALIETSAFCAGILMGEKGEKYKIYGNALGIAFQIIDDLLDITSDDSTLGKSAFSDFKEGKTTLPYMALYAKMSGDEKARLLSYFKKDLDANDKQWILAKMRQYGIIEHIMAIVESYEKSALNALDSGDSALREIAKAMLKREF